MIPAPRSTLPVSTRTARKSESTRSAKTSRIPPPRRRSSALSSALTRIPACTGYIVQLPLPDGIDTNLVLESVDPDKDADGLHPTNLGRLALRAKEPITSPLPCTPTAVIELLRRYEIDLDGKDVAVIGRGTTVGRSIGLLLTRRSINATVTLMHTGTVGMAEKVAMADVVVAAAGSPGLVRANWLKPGAVVLDVGVSRVVGEDGKARIVGDVDPQAKEVADGSRRTQGEWAR